MYKIGIVGAKNSGKTTLIEKLIEKLSGDNIKIMSVKHTAHEHSFDNERKDTFRHRKAGAKVTVAINKGEFALFSEYNENYLKKIEQVISDDFDVCLVEGDKFSDIPKFLLTRNIDKIDIDQIHNILATYGDEPTGIDHKHFHSDQINELTEFISSNILSIGGNDDR